MAHIVEFRSNATRSELEPEQEREAGRERGAQIIIFPGVRRERHAEASAKARRREKGRRKRDCLELLD